MLVQRVVSPAGGVVSCTVVDERFEPVGPIEDYLAHLQAIERSPNTVRAYASSLRLFFEHLALVASPGTPSGSTTSAGSCPSSALRPETWW